MCHRVRCGGLDPRPGRGLPQGHQPGSVPGHDRDGRVPVAAGGGPGGSFHAPRHAPQGPRRHRGRRPDLPGERTPRCCRPQQPESHAPAVAFGRGPVPPRRKHRRCWEPAGSGSPTLGPHLRRGGILAPLPGDGQSGYDDGALAGQRARPPLHRQAWPFSIAHSVRVRSQRQQGAVGHAVGRQRAAAAHQPSLHRPLPGLVAGRPVARLHQLSQGLSAALHLPAEGGLPEGALVAAGSQLVSELLPRRQARGLRGGRRR